MLIVHTSDPNLWEKPVGAKVEVDLGKVDEWPAARLRIHWLMMRSFEVHGIKKLKKVEIFLSFLVSYVGKGHGGLYKASIKEERRKRKAKRRERADQVD